MSADLDFSLAAMRRAYPISVETQRRHHVEQLREAYAQELMRDHGYGYEAARAAAEQVDFGKGGK